MGNGALPHGPSDRAHPRLYLLGPRDMSDLSPQSGPKRTLMKSLFTNRDEYTPTLAIIEGRSVTSGCQTATAGRTTDALAAPFFKISQRRSRSILPRFVPELPPERNDRHRGVGRGHRLPRLAIRQAGRRALRTKCPADLGRSKAQEPDMLSAARLGDPPNHARGRELPPLDIPRRLHGRERDHTAPRHTPPALQSRTHLQESPNRQARHR